MKRIVCIFVCVILVLSLSGCDSQDYKKAMDLFQEEEYASAREIFDALGDYKDAEEMSLDCTYNMAQLAYEEGDYSTAKELFAQLGDNEHAQQMVLRCDYDLAVELTQSGDYEAALALLEALGDYEDSAEYVIETKWGMLCDYIAENGVYSDDTECNALTWQIETDNSSSMASTDMVYLYAENPGVIVIQNKRISSGSGVALIRNLEITLERGRNTAAWEGGFGFGIGTATSVEIGEGRIDLLTCNADTSLELDSYSSEITDIYGRTKTSSNKNDSTMNGAMDMAWTELLEASSNILAETGLPVTMKDLGFALVE